MTILKMIQPQFTLLLILAVFCKYYYLKMFPVLRFPFQTFLIAANSFSNVEEFHFLLL